MNLMGPGSISETAAIARMEYISKAGDTRRSFAVADILLTRDLGARAPPVAATMAGVSTLIRHPDVNLGLLLVVAALLLDMGTSGASWTWHVSDQLNSAAMGVGWLAFVVGLGSLFVVLAAIWVDRRPPHGMMVAGAGILALGLVLVTLSRNFGAAAAGLFLVGAGGAAFHPLVFYAIAVKGYTRFRGTIIGILSLVFAANLGAGAVRNWDFDIPVGWFALALTLTGGIALYIFIPRWFRGNYSPTPTFREAIAVPGVRAGFVWAAAVYLVSAVILAAGSTHLRWVTAATGHDTGYQAMALAGGLGALAWGVAADFVSVRFLLIALAVLSLPAAAWVWPVNDLGGGALLLSFVRGGLISLPWVLAADLMPKRHFGKLALAILLLGTLGGSLGSFYVGGVMFLWGAGSFIWIALIESCILAAVVAWRPTGQGTGRWTLWWSKRA